MAKKRATTDYSFVVGIDKPLGMTSHDVVSACRRIYGERRIGHTGTLDPAASGVLVVCVGPATRLDRFMAGHAKTYEFTIVFGVATDTDDAQGDVISTAEVPAQVADPAFAAEFVAGLVGEHMQVPPAYSAIKVNGKRSYAAARAGNAPKLEARPIEIYSAELLSCSADVSAGVVWRVRTEVSGGTYVRSIARDVGAQLGTCAHVGDLRRITAGAVSVDQCVSLEQLEAQPFARLLDPVALLGYPAVQVSAETAAAIKNGRQFTPDEFATISKQTISPSPETAASACAIMKGERVSMVLQNRLVAIYEYDGAVLRSACGFSIGVERGNRTVR